MEGDSLTELSGHVDEGVFSVLDMNYEHIPKVCSLVQSTGRAVIHIDSYLNILTFPGQYYSGFGCHC